ncbi:hypothetical protein [Acinetobacter sp. ANC 4862]|uniref:hypothetical protein n=1 Tax=Acinetobacter sp. ANC 4862 TaxID=2529849 RepID=UPI00103B990A|nr:hypothetical protein [Acinetobacter sp. ANC 4862]TCH64244.1 hypothetical protein E0409_06635 [Acinetobacter sp. ANC 4862]
MNILNGNEAFAAMMAGRNILCRAVGELIEFDDLDRFPATIFATPGHEFCIKVETIEVAGITFTKPLTLDDVKEDMEIFLVYPDHVAHTKYTTLCKKYYECVRNGFAQADQENAELQLQAIGKLFGRTIAYPLTIESHIKIKKKRSTKTKNDADQASTPSDPDTATSNVVEEKTFESQPDIQITEQGPITAVEESLTEEFVETDAVKLVDKFTAQLNEAETVDAVMQIRYQLSANGHMVRGQIIELNKLGEKRIEALNVSQVVEVVPTDPDPVQLSQTVKSEYMLALTGATQLEAITILENEINKDSRLLDNQRGILNTYIQTRRRVINEASKSTEKTVQVNEDIVHQELLADLLDRVAKAASPAEANAQIKYTKSWTPEQRTPLISAINKRLVELNPPIAQPSLMVRIQRAENLTELDALEIDVSACDEEIQPRLMELVNKRRLELDPFNIALEGS